MKYNWISVLGEFEQKKEGQIVFHGAPTEFTNEAGVKDEGSKAGQFLCDQLFGEGVIECDVTFDEVDERSSCAIIIYFDSSTRNMVCAGIGDAYMFSVRAFDSKWHFYGDVGDRSNLRAKETISLKVTLAGSRVTLHANRVEVLSTNLPFPVPESQVGLFCFSKSAVTIENFKVTALKPRAFVVMQFTEPYDELYNDVIRPVCNDLGLDALRADETFTPGLIIADIVNKIVESKVVIAEISPVNANVYYEVGYAHAMKKPTILIADKNTSLPFDVSPFRTLFYENSIGGKARVEEGLRSYLHSIMGGKLQTGSQNHRSQRTGPLL